jgi:integrase
MEDNDTVITEEDVFNHDEIVSIATNTMYPLQHRALIAIVYLSLSRIGEVVKRLTRKQIDIIKINDQDVLVFRNLYTEKNKQHPKRNVPVIISKELDLVNVISEYISPIDYEVILFDFSRVTAWRHIKRMTGNRCHFLRHTRITHLQSLYNIPSSAIKRMAGWSDERPLSKYSHLKFQDIAELMM